MFILKTSYTRENLIPLRGGFSMNNRIIVSSFGKLINGSQQVYLGNNPNQQVTYIAVSSPTDVHSSFKFTVLQTKSSVHPTNVVGITTFTTEI